MDFLPFCRTFIDALFSVYAILDLQQMGPEANVIVEHNYPGLR